MKPRKKLKRHVPNDRSNHKTAEDFMRWWREQDARKKQVAADQAACGHLQALMVWADDGGVVG